MTLKIDGIKSEFIVDTGSTVAILPPDKKNERQKNSSI